MPPDPLGSAAFHDPLGAILACLRELGVPHVLIGGIAVSQLSQPRATADIDLLVMLDNDAQIAALQRQADACGFAPRIRDAVPFARRNRVLLLRHAATGIAVDLALGFLPFEKELVERSAMHAVGDLQLPLPTVEDLIVLKAVAHRERDLQDIRMLVEAHPVLDRQRIRAVVAEFAAALETPGLLSDLEALL